MKPQKLLRKILAGSETGRKAPFDTGRCLGMSDCHINIFYSDEDKGYVADIPDLDSCSAFGMTHEEALSEVKEAKAAWLEAAAENGKPIPEPRYRPAIYELR